jgi:hypothetical protein
MPDKEQARPARVAAAPVAIPTPEQLGIGAAKAPARASASAAPLAIPTPEQLGIGATR